VTVVAVRRPAYQVLADQLRAQITSGQLRPGARLPAEPQLCADAGVSRSTVREALRLLASENLIVTTRGVAGGSFVAHPSPEQLSDRLEIGVVLLVANSIVSPEQLFEVRRTLEIPVAGLAAERRTAAHLAQLDAALIDPVAATLSEILAAHRRFHLTLAEATGNPLYELVCRPLHAVVNEQELGAAASPEFWIRVDAAHRTLLAAVAAQDVPAAEAAARVHLDDLVTEARG
jgi:DNA-binding FadR family transcriptional regulator